MSFAVRIRSGKTRIEKDIRSDDSFASDLPVDDTSKDTTNSNTSLILTIPVAAMQSDEHTRNDTVYSIPNTHCAAVASMMTSNQWETQQCGSYDMIRFGMSLMSLSFCEKYIFIQLNHHSNSEIRMSIYIHCRFMSFPHSVHRIYWSSTRADHCDHSTDVLRWQQSNLSDKFTQCWVSYLCGVEQPG